MKNLKVIMADKGVTATRLSKELSISQTTLTGYSTSRTQNYNLKNVIKIADYLKVSLDELFGREPYIAGSDY